jgi:hypothetical protein
MTTTADLPDFQIDDKSDKVLTVAQADPAQGLRSEWIQEARQQTLSDVPRTATGDGAINLIGAKTGVFAEKFQPEVVVTGMPGESVRLPGHAQVDIMKDGSQRIGTTREGLKTPGPHDFVTVGADGSIRMSGLTAGSNFSVKVEGDRQIIGMPNGDKVVVQGGRIVEASTGGARTELLTPAEAKVREQNRANEAERMAQRILEKTAGSIADGLRNGNIPAGEIRNAFQNAKSPEHLTKLINMALTNNGTEKSPYSVSAERNIKTGELRVSIQNINGDNTSLSIPSREHFHKKVR